jgi:hypothetical protein
MRHGYDVLIGAQFAVASASLGPLRAASSAVGNTYYGRSEDPQYSV